MQINVGMLAEATDGPCGEVADVVVDPVRWRVTHLVIQPEHHHELARLVPIEAVVSNDADHAVLTWSTAQVHGAPVVQNTDFVRLDTWPHIEGGWDVGVSRMLAWPYYSYAGLGFGLAGYPYGYGDAYGWGGAAQVTMTYDRIPEGRVEVRRASQVLSSDSRVVGHVDGFLVDPAGKITHLVLERGHLWGHREITIPIDEIARRPPADGARSRRRVPVGPVPSAWPCRLSRPSPHRSVASTD